MAEKQSGEIFARLRAYAFGRSDGRNRKRARRSGNRQKDIDVFACAVGPGSFTGIRIGVATVKALAYALGKKVLGVTSFDSLAYNVSDGRKKLAVIDARHGNFYACGYAADGQIDLSPRFIDTAALCGLAREYEIISDEKSKIPTGFLIRLPTSKTDL